MSQQSIFDLAYVASKDPRIQALFAGTLGLPGTALDPGVRQATALQLALSGLVIDGLIDAAGADPYWTMLWRQNYGYTWYPSIIQPSVPVGPGLSFPGAPTYVSAPFPSGSIMVTTTPPAPFASTNPVPAPGSVSPIGVQLAPGIWDATEAAQTEYHNGDEYTDPVTGTKYTFKVVSFIGGNEYLWEAA